ncbi:DUF1697 domain-containing protein [Desulfosporosinus sp. PR]|uniref:DUF1697 domain-containing protein n=1 Tax=Candidatus Desulfosporosinus nitrosoreducens TaxID=3401928 RepID=UPI0027FC4B13|nr:DUF1697 domain-containing protein [Desulfosporosinus sp. PR]MDQ7094036.1 DUF1697 domain-containing protein [Desulfosporosinus sp. PR]
MAVYVALLRGINVGGKNKVKMADLKLAFEEIGLSKVQTYIQSGNVLFESPETEEALCRQIENKLEAEFGFHIPVILRTLTELERIIENCPFAAEEVGEAEAASKAESLYVGLLIQPPSQERIEQLSVYESRTDKFNIVGRDIYLLFHNSIRDSKLANNLNKLNVLATTRNWKTLNKLVQLAKAMVV